MITASNAYKTAMTANNRMWKLKVEIVRNISGSSAIDISDRINDCSINFDWDRKNASANLEINNYDYTLSPLNRNSPTNMINGITFDPLLDSNHTIRIYEGIRVSGNTYEYIQKFTGVLGDEIDADSYPGSITITARDKSKLLQDTYVYQSKSYGSSGSLLGMTLENVIQDMINQFLPSGNITVYSPTPSNVSVGKPSQPYTAKDTTLWDACQTLVDAFNHELRFLEDGTLLLKKVNRELDEETPVMQLDESDLIKDGLSMSDSDVRNHIVLRVTGIDPIEKKNEASIAKYGRRYMEITRSTANIITTKELAHEFVDGLLKELSYVAPVNTVEMPLNPLVQIGDVVTVSNIFTGTNPLLDIFRVVSVQDNFSSERKRTTLKLQGFQKVATTNLPAPNPPTGLTYTINKRVIQNYSGSGWAGKEKEVYFPMIRWAPPVTDVSGNALDFNFGGYTIYRQISSGGVAGTRYAPVASIASFIPAVGQVNYFYDYTISSGNTTYMIKAVSKYGQVSENSMLMNINMPQLYKINI